MEFRWLYRGSLVVNLESEMAWTIKHGEQDFLAYFASASTICFADVKWMDF
jgi:hypothetical protein